MHGQHNIHFQMRYPGWGFTTIIDKVTKGTILDNGVDVVAVNGIDVITMVPRTYFELGCSRVMQVLEEFGSAEFFSPGADS